MKNILIYCGANTGTNPIYKQTAEELGRYFAQNQMRMVYGGGGVGIMGIISREMMSAGGEVIGVIPHFLDELEVGNPNLTEMIKVNTMHERKTKMVELCDAAICLPGGYGSMDELFEMLTWAQLGLHQKPVGVLNVNGFYDFLLKQIDHMVQEGFVKPENRNLIISDSSIDGLIEKMHHYKPTFTKKWLSEDGV